MLKPTGKGLHLSLTNKTLDFVHQCMEDIYNAYKPNGEGDDGDSIQDEACADVFVNWLIGTSAGWRKETGDGKFAKVTVYKEMPYKEGTLRVTVAVSPGNNELKLDIRQWFNA